MTIKSQMNGIVSPLGAVIIHIHTQRQNCHQKQTVNNKRKVNARHIGRGVDIHASLDHDDGKLVAGLLLKMFPANVGLTR